LPQQTVDQDGPFPQQPWPFPLAAQVAAEMERVVLGAGGTGELPWAIIVRALTASNLKQWDLEDTTRDPGASDAIVAGAKRDIDRLNIGRHRLVQEIDGLIFLALDEPGSGPLATESPGMVLDRLSVLVIRRARTLAASSADPGYARRVPAIESQIGALSLAFDTYMDELRAGTRRFIPYEHFKLYREPAPAGD
jgi:Protein of unknown function (DUF4254)